jgi:cytochrome c biogenesis protein CcdA
MVASAIPLAAVAGAVSSVGPCAAPRYVALAGILGSSNGATRYVRAGAFILGVVAGSMFIVLSSAFAAYVMASSAWVYGALACVLAAGGCLALLDRPHGSCNVHVTRSTSTGSALLLGGLCSLIASPCCTPALIALGTATSSSAAPWFAASIGAAYAFGHIGVMATIAALSTTLKGALLDNAGVRAAQSISAGLMIALAGYYAVLA